VDVVAEAVEIASVIPENDEPIQFSIVQRKPVKSSDPEITLPILQELVDSVARKTMGIVRVIFINDELVPIITIQTVGSGTEPHKSVPILQDALHLTCRKTIVDSQMVKFYVIRLGKQIG
jgi:hypothetical protein